MEIMVLSRWSRHFVARPVVATPPGISLLSGVGRYEPKV
jgi:hypothetical protein